MSGSATLSSSARARSISHLPPVDFRYGINVGFWSHQVTLLWALLVYPIDVLFWSPTCTPWSTNARQWPAAERERQRQHESLTLQFLALCCFVQMLLGRSYVGEQPAGSDLFDSLPMSLVTGKDAHLPHHSFIFDQCMIGAKMDGEHIKKRTRLESDFEFQRSAPTCDGTHKHMILRGSNKHGPRTAQAAVYPAAMCDLILNEIQTRSSKIRSGGGENSRARRQLRRRDRKEGPYSVEDPSRASSTCSSQRQAVRESF